MKFIIQSFIQRPLLANLLYFGVLIIGVFAWNMIGKEELPEFESNWVRISVIYPGASAEDVELYVTKPIEDELKSVIGIEEINSTSSVNISSFRIVIDDDYPDKSKVPQEIQDAVLRAKLPSEVRDIPRIRQFKSAEKAILDIGLYHKEHIFLDAKSRQQLQSYVLNFESQLLSLNEISSIERSHYLKPQLQILASPEKLLQKHISLSEIKNQIQSNNIRQPVGALEDKGESKVVALNELEDIQSLESLKLRGNYEGQGVSLKDIAKVEQGFEKNTYVFKINGHEGVFLNVRKNVSTDILSAQKRVMKFIKDFKSTFKDSPIAIALMDDESYDVRNRLDIVTKNALLGFLLICLVLYIFLDAKSGFWVAMGIPFSACFALIIATLAGYTVNNMTLAAVIIVLGIVVDDAIIIAENIKRQRETQASDIQAEVLGTYQVIKPIIASILTTCVAFIPLLFFEGFFGKFVFYIPLIVIMMLLGSLIESTLVLPSHLHQKSRFWDMPIFQKRRDWFATYEKLYEKFILRLLQKKSWVLGFFILLLSLSAYLFQTKLKFVMFPREESKEVFIKFEANEKLDRYQTAKAIYPLEQIFIQDKENVVAVRSTIAQSRRGGDVRENQGSILVELHPANERKEALNDLLDRWEKKAAQFTDLEKVTFLRGRWGHASGNSIEILVQQNDDKKRELVISELVTKMKEIEFIKDVEPENPILKKEYRVYIDQEKLVRFNLSPQTITTALRSFVEGSVLYSINKGEEEVDVILSVNRSHKTSLDKLLELRVENQAGYYAYLKNVVTIKEIQKPLSINRVDFKRATMIYANNTAKKTPLEVAKYLEENIFPSLLNRYSNTSLQFKGEIEDSRASQGEFQNSILLVLFMIYIILAIMFNSTLKPLIILIIIPFGLAGVVYVLLAHSMSVFGFFAAVGALGMIGVVINDAIVMFDKLDQEVDHHSSLETIAQVAATRLRPVIVTTITTVVGLLPTAYGIAGYDSLLAEMMLTMGWGLIFGTIVTLALVPILYTFTQPRHAR